MRLINVLNAQYPSFPFLPVRCLQPEGLFKDPTDITHYIHCHKGEPHTMTCPDEMTWDDVRKSCFGKGKYLFR